MIWSYDDLFLPPDEEDEEETESRLSDMESYWEDRFEERRQECLTY